MADVAFAGVARGDVLQSGVYYRLTFGRRGLFFDITKLAGTTSDDDWFSEITRVYKDLPKSGVCYPVTPDAGATPGGSRAIIDVKASSNAVGRQTVAALASAAQQTCDRFGYDAVELLTVEKTPATNALAPAATAAREKASKKAEASAPDKSGGLGLLISVGYWAIVIALVAVVGFVAWKVATESKFVRAVV